MAASYRAARSSSPPHAVLRDRLRRPFSRNTRRGLCATTSMTAQWSAGGWGTRWSRELAGRPDRRLRHAAERPPAGFRERYRRWLPPAASVPWRAGCAQNAHNCRREAILRMLRINLGVLPWAVPGGSSSIPSDRAQNAQNSYAAAILRILRIDSL